jgi:4-hydroxybenzoate polyprenyltransferase
MSLEFVLNALLLFVAGVLVASAFYTLSYLADRKAIKDDREERGIYDKKRR